jgi:hypothetical protein
MEYPIMKRIPVMQHKLFACSFALSALVTATIIGVPDARAAVGDPVVQTAGNVTYVSGGIGLDAIARMESMASQHNLKLVFALRSGEYLSDVRVTIADSAGRTVLDTTSDGPWFLATLPRGNYQVNAAFAGRAERRTVAVGSGLRTVDFRWASE